MTGRRKLRDDNGSISRFVAPKIKRDRIYALADDHPAVVEGRTRYPHTLVAAHQSPGLLVSGHNNPKLGAYVTRGLRRGWPIYQLTLEERRTCPRSCEVWKWCYGNAMHWARRHSHGGVFEQMLADEVWGLGAQHPEGFLVRLHTLGDFYSVAYVELWRQLLAEVPALAVFGYTARCEMTDDEKSRDIARAVADLAETQWNRFSIRFSRPFAQPQGAMVVDHAPRSRQVIVCPAQTGGTTACATCGLCWAPAAREKTIAFLRHGATKSGPGKAAGQNVKV